MKNASLDFLSIAGISNFFRWNSRKVVKMTTYSDRHHLAVKTRVKNGDLHLEWYDHMIVFELKMPVSFSKGTQGFGIASRCNYDGFIQLYLLEFYSFILWYLGQGVKISILRGIDCFTFPLRLK